MKTVRMALALGVAAGLILAASCGEPPEAEARGARSALAELRDLIKAPKWAPEEHAAAATAVEAADREVAAQMRRLSFNRDYAKAKEMYARAIADVELAKKAALASKQAAEKQAREALDAAIAAISHAEAALTIAPVSRGKRYAFERLDRQLGDAEARVQEVRNLIVAEEYKDATAQADELLEQVSSLLRSLSLASRP